MDPIIYRSTDASAPVLDGNNGSFLNVLDACLVNGYGSKAAAGWSKPFVGTNIAAYRAGAGPRHYVRVHNAHATLGQIAVRGYTSMSDVNTGPRPFPNVGQVSGEGPGYTISASKDALVRPWEVFADDRTFYFICTHNSIAAIPPSWTVQLGFGEFFSAVAGDTNRSFCGIFANAAGVSYLPGVSPAGVAAITAINVGNWAATNHASFWTVAWPNPVDSAFYIDYMGLAEGSTTGPLFSSWRGRFRGLYTTPHAASNFSEGDTFDGTGDFAGKSFFINITYGIFETTAWDTNAS